MNAPSPFAFTMEEADKLNKVFIVECFLLLLEQIFPETNDDEKELVKEIANVAEEAMTEMEDISKSQKLHAAVLKVTPAADQCVGFLTRFSSNIIGVMQHNGPEILEGTFTAKDFFKM